MTNKRVLLVDDDETILTVMGEMLTCLGYGVEAKRNGEEAFTAFLEDPRAFDLIITDYSMPRMRGTELARKVLELRPERPVILMSAGDPEMEGEMKGLEIKRFLQKPIGLEHLKDAIEAAFRA